VTTSSFREEEARARKVCEGFIRKPFNRADLVAELRRFLKPVGKREVAAPTLVGTTGPRIEQADGGLVHAHAKRPEILARLREQRETIWPRLRQTMDVGEIEDFAGRLKTWAAAGHLPELQAYAAKLSQDIEVFDVDRLPKTLEDFPSVCDAIASSPG
jgi:hypothetical protein